MAINKYSQLQNTPYVQTYQPIDFNQVGPLMQQAAGFRAAQQEADANTDALLSSVAPNDPEGQEFIRALTERQKQSIVEREGESLADRATRAKTAGIRTAGAVNAYKNAKQQIADWRTAMQEANTDVAQEDLSLLMQMDQPQMRYDVDNFAVTADIPGVQRYAPDVNLTEKFDEYGAGIKSSILGFDVTNADGETYREPFFREKDPETGKMVVTTREGVPAERVITLMDKAAKGDPEIQQFLNRKRKVYTAQAEQMGGTDALGSLLTNAPDEARDRLVQRIQGMREKGLSDSQIYGDLRATQQLRDAQGFGVTKYAFEEMNQDYVSPTQASLKEADETIRERINEGRGYNNPFATTMPQEILTQDQETIDSLSSQLSNTYQTTGQKTAGDQEILTEIAKIRSATPTNVESLDEFFSSDFIKKNYGSALDQLREDMPKGEDESNDAYIERLNSKYKEMVNTLGSMRHNYIALNPDARAEAKADIVGEQGVNGQIGQIVDLPIIPLKVDDDGNVVGEEEPIRLEELADELGLEMDDPEFRSQLVERLSLADEFRGNDPSIPSGYVLSAATKEGGILGFGADNVIKQYKVPKPDLAEQATFEDRRKLSELKFNPRKSTADVKFAGIPIEAKTENVYVDAETGEQVPANTPGAIFKDRIVVLKNKETGEEVRENTPEYNALLGMQ